MHKIITTLTQLLARYTSYGISIAISTAVSAIIATIFAIFYAKATKFPLTDMILYIGLGTVAFGFIMSSIQFGILSKIGFIGFTKSVKAVNQFIETNPETKIKDDLTDNEYHLLLKSLVFLPINNSLTAVFWAVLAFVAMSVYGYINGLIHGQILVSVGIMLLIITFLHGGFSLILGEIGSGRMRSKCKEIMHEKGISIEQKAISTVKLKLIFFIILFIITIYVSNTIIYYNRENLITSILFSGLALLVSFLMAYLIFYLIYSGLQEIKSAMNELKDGQGGLLFTKSIDEEFIDVAQGVTGAAITIHDYQHNLEKKVEERTNELKESLGRVEFLKGQQDGDYFLTSLLLKPLIGNYSDNKNVKIEMLIKQKKTFTFKNKSHDLGGDLCIAYNIVLRERKYTLFLNADAMGKSMQGAGGALVLGAVFQTVVERSRFSDKDKNLTPERWLKNAFLEFHKAFESFDGSMLMSLVIGITDDENGFTYFINAEHPWVVLCRNQKAKFIEDDLYLRKLGTGGMEGPIYIQTFHMQNKDTLFLGSDGRDDLLLGIDKNGSRIINEDENLFLKNIEEGDGNLYKILDKLRDIGEITDDLSIMRIEFNQNTEEKKLSKEYYNHLSLAKKHLKENNTKEVVKHLLETLNYDENDISSLKVIAWSYSKLKNYQEAIKYFSKYIELVPEDEKAIYATAYIYDQLKNSILAIDTIDKLRIRHPKSFKFNSFLANQYIQLNAYERAKKIINDFLHFFPDHKKALELKKSLPT